MFLPAVFQKIRHVFQFPDRLVVAGFRMFQVHVHDQHDFLAEVVKSDDLVEEHQVHILEPLRVFGLPFGRRLPVSQVIIGKIPYQTSCERRQIIKSRTLMIP